MNTVITYSRYGGPEVLSLSDAVVPQPGPGQVRIRVKAVAVNPIDAKIRSGRLDGFFPAQFPVLPGWDVAGVIDAVGDGTGAEGASAAVGDEVFGVASVGGYSQYALLDRPVPKPAALSFETAAAIVTVGGVLTSEADRAPEALPELAALLADGRLTVPVWRSYPLAEAARAHADLDTHRNHGKIILLP
jgi:NADPH:quinone reductase-like Zn-dependent oxidoreductase